MSPSMKPCNNRKVDDAAGASSTEYTASDAEETKRKEGRNKLKLGTKMRRRWSQVSWQPSVEPLRAWRAGDLPREPPLAPEEDGHDTTKCSFLVLSLS